MNHLSLASTDWLMTQLVWTEYKIIELYGPGNSKRLEYLNGLRDKLLLELDKRGKS